MPGDYYFSFRLYELAVVMACIAIVFLFFPLALQFTYDSYDYIAASENLPTYVNGKNADGVPFLHRPPLLPAFLNCFDDKAIAAWWLNVLSYAASLLLCAKIAQYLNVDRLFFFLTISIIAFSFPFLQNHFFLLTEPLFSLLTILLCYLLVSNRSIYWVITVCVLLILLRKAGLFIAAAASISLALNREPKKAAAILLSSIIVFGVWEIVVFNYHDRSSLTIVVNHSYYSRIHYADALSSWIIPRWFPLLPRITIVMAFFCIGFVLFRKTFCTCFVSPAYRAVVVIPLVYVLSFLVLFGMPDYHEAERYLSVVMPLCVMSILVLADRIKVEKYGKIVLVLICVWWLYPVTRTFHHLLNDLW